MEQPRNTALIRAAYILILSALGLWTIGSSASAFSLASGALAATGTALTLGNVTKTLSLNQYHWMHSVCLTLAILSFGVGRWDEGTSQYLMTAFTAVAVAALAGRQLLFVVGGYVVYSLAILLSVLAETPDNLGYQIDASMRGVDLGGFVLLIIYAWKQRLAGMTGEADVVRSFGRALLLVSIFPALMLPYHLLTQTNVPGILLDTFMGWVLLAGLGAVCYRINALSERVRWAITLVYGGGFVVSLSNVGSLALPVIFLSIPIAFFLLERVYALGLSLIVVILPLSLSQLALFDLSVSMAGEALFSGLVIVGISVYMTGKIDNSQPLIGTDLLVQRIFWVRFFQVFCLCLAIFALGMAPLHDKFITSIEEHFSQTLFLPAGVALTLFCFLGFLAGRSAVEHIRLHKLGTMQRESINELAAAQRRLDRVASNADVVFLRVDLKTDRVTSNRLWRERWKYSDDEQIAFTEFKTRMSPEASELFTSTVEKVRTRKVAQVVNLESRRQGPNWARLHFAPELDENGEVTAIEITNVDITKELVARQELAEANRNLNQTLERQREMFAVIGHELRTPVASVEMLLGDDETTPEQKLRMIADINQSLLGVLDDLRVVVSPERAQRAKSEIVSPQKLILRTLGPMTSLIQKGGLKLNLELGGSDEQCEFNAQALRRLVNNLVKNAVIHAEATNLWVRLERQAEQAYRCAYRLTIEDDGKGISSAFETELFKAFSRGDTNADGTGLGLHICRELSELLNGTIGYQRSAQGGAAFIVDFSLDLAPQKTKRIEAQDPGEPTKERGLSLKNLRILVAEDEQLLRMLTTKQLSKIGAQVVACENGKAALKAFRDGEFDLVLTDIMMPVMDGYGFTKALRDFGYSGPIFGVTAAVVGDETQRLLDAGADLVLEKPLKTSALKEACSGFDSLKPQPPRVILVDDDPVTLTHISMKLSNLGIECACFEQERDAFAALSSAKYDAIILDVHLKERNSLDLLPYIRAVSSAPVLFITADDSPTTLERIKQIKDAIYFLKSDLEEMTDYLSKAV